MRSTDSWYAPNLASGYNNDAIDISGHDVLCTQDEITLVSIAVYGKFYHSLSALFLLRLLVVEQQLHGEQLPACHLHVKMQTSLAFVNVSIWEDILNIFGCAVASSNDYWNIIVLQDMLNMRFDSHYFWATETCWSSNWMLNKKVERLLYTQIVIISFIL